MNRWLACLLVTWSAVVSACGDEATQVIVVIDADEDVVAQASVLRLQVFGRSRDGEFPQTPILDNSEPVFPDQWPLRHVVAPLDNDNSRIYRISARAFQGTRFVAEAKTDSGFVGNETRILRMQISGGDCLNVQCTRDTACIEQGICGDIPFVEPGDLEKRGENRDAGVDADPGDAGDGGACVPGATCDPGRALGACEVAETDCTGGVASCAVRLRTVAESFECRASTGVCDTAEVCNGTSPDCGKDEFASLGTSCGTDQFCIDGQCSACTAGEACETGNACEKGVVNCDSGAPVCDPVGPADPGTVCRAAAGLCDAQEFCDGVSTDCPADGLQAVGFACRPSAGGCDVQEECDGVSAACPSDAFRAPGFQCREPVGDCDEAELCTGTSACPADTGPKPMGTICRAAADECDEAEICDGAALTCGDDVFAAAGTTCQDTKSCDGAGECIDLQCGMPCDTGKACEVGVFVCSGTTVTCEPSSLRGSETVCRPSAGVCDTEERCTGSSPDCPADGFTPSSVECRAGVGVCDAPEFCTGAGPDCPADALFGSGQVCRPVGAGETCGVAEVCDGTSVNCPADVHQPLGFTCRPATQGCDLPEVCSGTAPTCPADTLRSNGFECRPASGSCDVAETCDGASPACPADGFRPSGVVCLAKNGVCDAPDRCTGSSPTCPPTFEPSSTICRNARRAGDGTTCDVDEFCTGTSTACPADMLLGAGTVCRPSISSCDAQEVCSGASPNCPIDDPVTEGAPCVPSGGLGDCEEAYCDFDKSCNVAPAPPNFPCSEGVCDDFGACKPMLRVSEVLPAVVAFPNVVDGFVELYNPSAAPFSLFGNQCLVTTIDRFGTTLDYFPVSGDVVPAFGYFLISVPARLGPKDQTFSSGPDFPDVNCGTVIVDCDFGSFFASDVFGWAHPADSMCFAFGEGQPFPGLAGGQNSYERKACIDSTSATMTGSGLHATAGNAEDTDDNARDFVPRNAPGAQTSGSPAEFPACP